MYHNIQNGAIFISDAHYNDNRLALKRILLQIQSKEIITNQLFLMGDIFDFLIDEAFFFQNKNAQIIKLINDLSVTIEIIYLEGNHDFCLSKTFTNVLVIPRDSQPFMCKYKNFKIALAHGDIMISKIYNLFTSVVRSKIVLKIVFLLNFNNWFFKYLNNWLLTKNICTKFDNFIEFAERRQFLYKNFQVDYIIEGHFHQGKSHNKYTNLPSLACENRILKIEDIVK